MRQSGRGTHQALRNCGVVSVSQGSSRAVSGSDVKKKTQRSLWSGRVPLSRSSHSPCLPQQPASRGRSGGRRAAGHLRLQELRPDVLHREGAQQPHVLSQRPVAVTSREAGAAGEGRALQALCSRPCQALGRRRPGVIYLGKEVSSILRGAGKPGAGQEPALQAGAALPLPACPLCLLKSRLFSAYRCLAQSFASQQDRC